MTNPCKKIASSQFAAGCAGHPAHLSERGLGRNRRRDLARSLRQRTVSDPIGGRETHHEQNRYAQVDELEESSIRHWEDSTASWFEDRSSFRSIQPAQPMIFRLLILIAVLTAERLLRRRGGGAGLGAQEPLARSGREGQVGAQAALNLLANPARLLSVTQVGVTLASLGLGWAGENSVYDLFLSVLQPVMTPSLAPLLHGVSFGLAFLLISYAHVVLGEVVPKNLAIEKADRLAILVAPALLVFDRISAPFVFFAERSAAALSRWIGLQGQPHRRRSFRRGTEVHRQLQPHAKAICIASRKTPSRRCSSFRITTRAKSWCRATRSCRFRWMPASIKSCGACARINTRGCRCTKAIRNTSSATCITRT